MALRHAKPTSPSDEILHLKGNDAKKFLEHLSRQRSPEEIRLYAEADKLYAKHCKI
ncbi:MAG: hypothetical protein KGH87_04965 [Thaumarchaeota archaeon]|nr:hypothetical protein [Nitrososphaerota archaeon]MDE1839253.1 hypothetical protein [Nitrososphaerota archaeon]